MCCVQEKQAENNDLRRRVESTEKTMKDMKTKYEYVSHFGEISTGVYALYVSSYSTW